MRNASVVDKAITAEAYCSPWEGEKPGWFRVRFYPKTRLVEVFDSLASTFTFAHELSQEEESKIKEDLIAEEKILRGVDF